MTIVAPAEQLWTEEDIDSEGHQTYESGYRVKSDYSFENPITVREAIGVPNYGDQYSWGGVTNPDAYCNHKKTKFEKIDATFRWWLVLTTHSTKPGTSEQTSGGLRGDPVSDNRWKIGGSFVNGTRFTSIDKDGFPIQTTALERKSLEVPDGYDTLTLEGPSAFISIALRSQAIRHCNELAIWGLTPRQLYMAQWQYDCPWHGATQFVYHRLTFWIKYEGWNEKWVNEGTQTLDFTSTGQRIINRVISHDDLGGGKVYLDSTGQSISLSSLVNPSTGEPLSNPVPPIIINQTEVIPEFDFQTLGFPDPLPGPFI